MPGSSPGVSSGYSVYRLAEGVKKRFCRMVVSGENVRCLICTVGHCALCGVNVVGRLHGGRKLHSRSCASAGMTTENLLRAVDLGSSEKVAHKFL